MAPLVKKSGKLPGTDPMFHQMKPYMTPVMYKGKRILAFVGSCRQNGCNYTQMWVSNEARDAGYFSNHRSPMVLKARREFFAKGCNYNPNRINNQIQRYADKNSHTYADWADVVEAIYRAKVGVPFELERSNNKLQVNFHLGYSATEMVKHLYAENFGE